MVTHSQPFSFRLLDYVRTDLAHSRVLNIKAKNAPRDSRKTSGERRERYSPFRHRPLNSLKYRTNISRFSLRYLIQFKYLLFFDYCTLFLSPRFSSRFILGLSILPTGYCLLKTLLRSVFIHRLYIF